LVLGRAFDAHDDAAGPKVAIVNESFARHYFPGRNPIGGRVGSSKDKVDIEIVGVVKDGKYTSLRETPLLMMYVPGTQVAGFFTPKVVHLRTAGDPAALAGTVRTVAREVDRNVPVFDIATVQQEIDRSLTQDKLIATLCGVFSGLALCLSARSE